MAFTDDEIAEYTGSIEQLFWSRRRPPLQVREQMREGQRFAGQSIEFFFVRPAFDRPGQFTEESIAKISYVRARGVWQLFWKRADGKWHGYQPCRETKSLAAALRTIDADAFHCFFG